MKVLSKISSPIKPSIPTTNILKLPHIIPFDEKKIILSLIYIKTCVMLPCLSLAL